MVVAKRGSRQSPRRQIFAAEPVKLERLPPCTLLFAQQQLASLSDSFHKKIVWIREPKLKRVVVHSFSRPPALSIRKE
jgi:hypothetical protein